MNRPPAREWRTDGALALAPHWDQLEDESRTRQPWLRVIDGGLAEVAGSAQADQSERAAQVTYDSNNNLTAEDLANGVDNTYSFDYDNNVSSISDGTSGATFAATYTRNGDDLIASDSSQPSNKDYTYTSKKQVCYAYSSSETCGSSNSGAYAYAYDGAGNLTTDNGNTQYFNTSGSSSYGKTDELCWSGSTSGSSCGTTPTGDTSYTYNTNGDRTAATPSSGSASAYSYNDFNQLTQYQLGSGTATTYTYDGTGLRMSKTTGSSTTQYSWSGDGSDPELLQETAGSSTTSYIYGPNGLPIEEILPSGSAYYYSSDAQGSTRALTKFFGNDGRHRYV